MKKEQTIEQASEYYAHNYFDMHETNNYKALKQGFINGAKWQQEQQDKFAIEFGDWIGKNTIAYNNGKFRMKTLKPVFLTSEQLLEQFKKK